MTLPTLVRRVIKITLFILLSILTGRTLGSCEKWANYNFIASIGHFFYGAGEIGADNFYELYFYIDVVTVFSVTTLIYILAMKIIKLIRKG